MTSYRAAGTEVRLGCRVPDTLPVGVGTFLTAWNPLSRRMPRGWNERMQRNLLQRLRRHGVLLGDGVHRRWHEAHLLVAGDPRPMLRLAHVFRQRAVVIVRRGRKPQLRRVR